MKILEEYKSNDSKESFVDAYLDTLPIVFRTSLSSSAFLTELNLSMKLKAIFSLSILLQSQLKSLIGDIVLVLDSMKVMR
jgi:hypothetical protein